MYFLFISLLYNCVFQVYGEDVPYMKQSTENQEEQIGKLSSSSYPYAKIAEVEHFERELYSKILEEEEYDFIVVGAGAAGATVASRLSEVPNFKILLLEAGDEEDDITRIPSLSFHLLFSKYNWGYFTTPQKHWCFGSKDRKCLLAMGKALGGSTAINGMLWARGNPKDYNLWAQQGNEGWSYEELLPYFKKSEDSNIKHYSSHHQGKGGKVHLENSHFESHATEYILRAAKELKIPYVNYNAGDQMGIGHAQGALKDGKRWSSARAYLEPAEKKSNLIIKSKSTVLKVLIDENKVAYGVQYIQNGTLYEAHTRKEVILSAGGMATPKLLMLSGIGRKKELEKLQIETLSNLNVGSPLRTHLAFPGIKFIFDKSPLSPENRKEEIVEYLKHGKGPLTAFSADLVAYFKTKVSQDEHGYPDIELTFSPKRSNDRLAVAVNVVLMHPKSTGTIKLLSKDPLDPPLIDPSYLSDENDMNTVLAGIRIAQTFTKTDVFKTYGGHLDSEPLPACSFEKFDSDSYWRCAVQHQSICLSDPAGTAKMGGENDTDAVVDSKLKVHGIKHLRVVDNSVIPISVTGHMMAPAYMIGEKAADIIKYFWKSK